MSLRDQKSKPEANTSDERPTLHTPVKSDDDPRTLTIEMYYMGSSSRDPSSFCEIYTRALEWQHPNVEIEITSVVDEQFPTSERFSIDTTAELRKMITSDKPPDVLFLGYNDYLALMEEDLFVALNPLLTDSELSFDDFEPIVADGLVNPQDGQIYGLSPYFLANALIYNKDLFDEMKVPYPRDHMTWEEMFALAKQMTLHSEEKNIFGFAFDIYSYSEPSMHNLWHRYLHSLGVQIYDKKTGKSAVNNDRLENALTSIKDLYDAGVFPTLPPEPEESEEDELNSTEKKEQLLGHNKFYSNTIAMGIVTYGELRYVIEETIAGYISIPNWDVVSIPIHPELPHVGAGVVTEPVIVINANGRNQLDAWRLIESIHSPEWARINEERYTTRLSLRKDYAANLAELDYNKAAFYQLDPGKYYEPQSESFGLYNPNRDYIIRGHSFYQDILLGRLGVREALEQWENSINNFEDQLFVW